MRCMRLGVWLYFHVGLRYREVEELSAERDRCRQYVTTRQGWPRHDRTSRGPSQTRCE
jgi:transposase-like protein